MAATAVFLLCLVALAQGSVIIKNDPRIVNGYDAKIGEIPYQVSLQNRVNNFHFCGGSVLSNYYVITAAHCVSTKSVSSLQVVAGSIDLKKPHSIHQITKIIVHENYQPSNSWHNDIALLRTHTPFVKSKLINFVPLPQPGDIVKANDVATVSGWGRLYQGGPTIDKLQRVDIYIADQEYCQEAYRGHGQTIHDSHICAHYETEMKGSCNGDSGGPLTVKGKLVGLVSWAAGCAQMQYPTVYTRVSSFLDWIAANAK